MLDVPTVVELLQQLPVLGACVVRSTGWLRMGGHCVDHWNNLTVVYIQAYKISNAVYVHCMCHY